jgi:hypothetical protein
MQVEHPLEDLRRKVPVWLYLFDLLYLDRYDTRQVPLRMHVITAAQQSSRSMTWWSGWQKVSWRARARWRT